MAQIKINPANLVKIHLINLLRKLYNKKIVPSPKNPNFLPKSKSIFGEISLKALGAEQELKSPEMASILASG